jgi:16S rRNA (guanine(966)-N(2))-methyltransferase RsmD
MTTQDKPAGSGGRSTRAGASGRSGAARATGPLEVATAKHDRKKKAAAVAGGAKVAAGSQSATRKPVGKAGAGKSAAASAAGPKANAGKSPADKADARRSASGKSAGKSGGGGKPSSARPNAPAPLPPAVVPNEVRLIGGQWKRSKLPVADRPGLRPTPDRVRETLFNWLGQDLSGWRVLDAFAGTGALGFEAASRGATQVVLLENDGALIKSLNASRLKLAATQLSIYRGEALVWMRTSPSAFDLVLLDPPFEANLFDQALAAARPRLAPGGMIYLESDREVSAEVLTTLGLEVWRSGRAGRVFFHLLRAAELVVAQAVDSAPAPAADDGSTPAN